MISSDRLVFDSSAILAILFEEPGADLLNRSLRRIAFASTVNLAEAQAKMVKRGYDPEDAWEDALSAVSFIEPFSSEQAKVAGTLIAKTHSLGLSLGDRACLALAIALHAPVYTTDQAWRNLNLGIPIHILR